MDVRYGNRVYREHIDVGLLDRSRDPNYILEFMLDKAIEDLGIVSLEE